MYERVFFFFFYLHLGTSALKNVNNLYKIKLFSDYMFINLKTLVVFKYKEKNAGKKK